MLSSYEKKIIKIVAQAKQLYDSSPNKEVFTDFIERILFRSPEQVIRFIKIIYGAIEKFTEEDNEDVIRDLYIASGFLTPFIAHYQVLNRKRMITTPWQQSTVTNIIGLEYIGLTDTSSTIGRSRPLWLMSRDDSDLRNYQVMQETAAKLANHGITIELLKKHWSTTPPNDFNQTKQEILIYLITGIKNNRSHLNPIPTLRADQLLEASVAIKEILYLSDEKIDALMLEYAHGLTGDHLRSWVAPLRDGHYESFSFYHRLYLSALMHTEPKVEPGTAIDVFLDMTTENDARRLYQNLTRSSQSKYMSMD